MHLWDEYVFVVLRASAEVYFCEKVFSEAGKGIGGSAVEHGRDGQNFKPSPMTDQRLLGRLVVDSVKLWSSRLSGREK